LLKTAEKTGFKRIGTIKLIKQSDLSARLATIVLLISFYEKLISEVSSLAWSKFHVQFCQ
jgi:hypothetical protein